MALAYVAGLCGDDRLPQTWQTLSDRRDRDPMLARVIHGPLREVGRELIDLNLRGAGVFCTVARTDLQGRKAQNVVGIRNLFVDFDAEPQKQPHLAPSMIIASGSGPHWYWMVDDCPVDGFATAQKRLALHYGSDPVVHDLPRVMRVPGFWHLKRDPLMVSLVAAPGYRYSLRQIVGDLPAIPAPCRPRPTDRPFSAPSAITSDPVAVFVGAGMYGRQIGEGKHSVVCPWTSEHTHQDWTGTDGSTVLWETGTAGRPVWHCSHAHCSGRYLVHALRAIDPSRSA